MIDSFGKKLKGGNNSTLAFSVENATGQKDICNLWKSHYENLLNCSKDTSYKKKVIERLVDCTSHENRFTPKEIADVIKHLKNGKSCGRDSLQSEHFKYCDNKIFVLLSLLFNCMISHGYICDGLMDTILIPIIKDKKGDLSSKNNYRPIAITSVISKILESVILNRYQDCLATEHNQFGFKDSHSTDLCIMSLKHVIDYYSHMSSPLYICYLDASKAFDRLNFWVLFQKLLDRNLPPIIVRLLAFWYTNQKFIVRWGSTTSSAFGVSNGVRQGGVLSPYLFNVYMDGLSAILNQSNIGCVINNVSFNHFMYADDTVLVAPSAMGLQKLICLCENYADSCEVIFNSMKSKYMCVRPRDMLHLPIPSVYLKGAKLDIVSDYKYLGMIICDNKQDDKSVASQIRGLYSRGNALIKHFKYCSDDVKSLLFKTYCSSFYCCQLWANCTSSSRNRIKVAHNRIFRVLLKLEHRISMSHTFVLFNIHHSSVILRNAVNGFYSRLQKSENRIIQTIVNSDYFIHSPLHCFWFKLTDTINM